MQVPPIPWTVRLIPPTISTRRPPNTMTVWQTPTYSMILLRKFSHSNSWVSLSATIFLGQTTFQSWLPKPVGDLGILFPSQTWTLIHLQGRHLQLDGVLLSSLGLRPCLTPCSAWRRGNQGLQDYWNVPWWIWIYGPRQVIIIYHFHIPDRLLFILFVYIVLGLWRACTRTLNGSGYNRTKGHSREERE